jgi:hypothetical protein
MAKRLTIAALAAGLVLTAVGGWTLSRGQTRVAEGFYRDRLIRCDDHSTTSDDITYMSKAQQCVADVMTLALSNDDISTFIPDLERAVDDNDFLYQVCHPAAHTAGKQALEASDDLFTLLNEVAKSTVCDWGFGHGVIDTLALRGEDNETLDQLVRWCEEHVSDERLYGLCADSIGHYSWISTQNLERSAVNCARVQTPQGKSSCGGGIMMQMFEPAASAGSYSRVEAPELIPEICRRWMKVAPIEIDYLGCSHGAGYVYGLRVRDAAWNWLNDKESLAANSTPPEALEPVIGEIKNAVKHCENLPMPSESCVRQVMSAIPLQWGHRFPEDQQTLCEVFGSAEIVKACAMRRDQASI